MKLHHQGLTGLILTSSLTSAVTARLVSATIPATVTLTLSIPIAVNTSILNLQSHTGTHTTTQTHTQTPNRNQATFNATALVYYDALINATKSKDHPCHTLHALSYLTTISKNSSTPLSNSTRANIASDLARLSKNTTLVAHCALKHSCHELHGLADWNATYASPGANYTLLTNSSREHGKINGKAILPHSMFPGVYRHTYGVRENMTVEEFFKLQTAVHNRLLFLKSNATLVKSCGSLTNGSYLGQTVLVWANATGNGKNSTTTMVIGKQHGNHPTPTKPSPALKTTSFGRKSVEDIVGTSAFALLGVFVFFVLC